MKNFIVRTITGIIFVAAIVASFLRPEAMVLLFSLVTGLTVWEFTGLVNERPGVTVNRFICTVAGVYFFYAMTYFCSDLYGGASWIGFWDWNYTELMDGADPNNYQGVCPDGWRLPTAKDWKNLAQFVVDQYGSDSVDAGMVLFDDGATGFGVKKIVQMDENAGNLRIRVLGNPMFAAIPDFETMPHTFTFSDLLFVHRGAMSIMFDSEDKQYLNMQDAPIYNYDFAYEPYFIRCVKD